MDIDPETAAVNKQLDSHVGGDIYKPMKPFKTYVALYKWRKNSSYTKRRQIKLGTYLARLTPIKYLGPHNVSACWSSSIYKRQLSLIDLTHAPIN